MSTISMALTASMERALQSACIDMGTQLITNLAEHYAMDFDEMMMNSGLNDIKTLRAPKKGTTKGTKGTKTKKANPSMPMPFTGVIDQDACFAIRPNLGLYTQCLNERVGEKYCKTCAKHAAKNASGKPTHGDIQDRMDIGLMDFQDAKGKLVIPYINVLEKKELSVEAAREEAAKFGIDIPEIQFEKRVKADSKKRGRKPKAKATETVTDDLLACVDAEVTEAVDAEKIKEEKIKEEKIKEEKIKEEKEEKAAAAKAKRAATAAAKKAKKEADEAAAAKAKRAATRAANKAKKAKKEAEEEAEALALKEAEEEAEALALKEAEEEAEALALKEAEEAEEALAAKTPVRDFIDDGEYDGEDDDEDDDEDEVKVTRKTIDGVEYLVDSDNIVYDVKTNDPLYYYDEETKELKELEDEEDEEE